MIQIDENWRQQDALVKPYPENKSPLSVTGGRRSGLTLKKPVTGFEPATY